MAVKQKPRPITFPYKKYRAGMAPVIPIRVLARHRWYRVWAYVDSGAAYSVLTVAQARRLGLIRVKGRRVTLTSGGGDNLGISLHRLWVKLGVDRLSITFGVPRGFDIDFNLLGRRDLFHKYLVCFNDSYNRVTFLRQSLL